MPSFSMRLRSVFGWSLRIRAAPLGPCSETNAHDQLDDSTQPLTERDAEAHDGSHRREERSTVVDEMHGDQPGEPRRERRLHDRHGGVSPPRQPTREFLAKA